MGYYVRARAWLAASPRVRVALTAKRAFDFRRIVALGDLWGLKLDELHASYSMLRWAGAPQLLAEREPRYRALVKLLMKHGDAPDLGRRFRQLAASLPKVGRRAPRH